MNDGANEMRTNKKVKSSLKFGLAIYISSFFREFRLFRIFGSLQLAFGILVKQTEICNENENAIRR